MTKSQLEALETMLRETFAAQGASDAAGLAKRAAKDFDMDQRDKRILGLSRQGLSAALISRREGLTQRHVERILSEQRRLEREQQVA